MATTIEMFRPIRSSNRAPRAALAGLAGALAALLVGIPASAGSNLSQEALYHRCYQHIVGRRPAFGDPALAAVVAGTTPAIVACQTLVDRALLTPAGALAAPADPIAKLALQNINTFHRTWFRSSHVTDNLIGPFEHLPTGDVIDGEQGALQLTYATLHPSVGFASAVTSPAIMIANREAAPGGPYAERSVQSRILITAADSKPFFYGLSVVSAETISNPANVRWTPLLVLPGELIGVRPATAADAAILPDSVLNPNAIGAEKLASTEPGFVSNFNINRSWGGGIIGTPAYLMMNWGHNMSFVSDGAVGVPRRWAVNILQDLLCRPMPVNRLSDAIPYLATGTSPTIASFRKSAACIRCHASMDQMALAARNFRTLTSDRGQDPGVARTIETISNYTASSSSPGWSATPVADFHKTNPDGRLYFRSYDGTLVSRPVSSVADLGAKLSETNDLYACAAKRWFKYLSGVDVSLHDVGDPLNEDANGIMKDKDWEYRRFVIALGMRLKATGNVRAMIKEIFASKYYQQTDYGRTSPAEAQ